MIRLGSHERLGDLTNQVGLLDKGPGLASKRCERHQQQDGEDIAHGLSFLAIKVGTPVARRPLADPGVRNYRNGLLGWTRGQHDADRWFEYSFRIMQVAGRLAMRKWSAFRATSF